MIIITTKKYKLKLLCLIIVSFTFCISCKKSDSKDSGGQISARLPVLTTTPINSTTEISAISGGNITSDGGTAVIARGVCWSTSANPSTANNKTLDGSGTGIFTSSVTGLSAGVTYYLRAYATNSVGTSYGAELNFSTSNPTSNVDVFAAGYEFNGINNVAKVWKNGIATSLTDGSNDAQATSVYVSGSDIYVAGYEMNGGQEFAKVWKNGIATSLSAGLPGRTQGVYISGADIYLTGYLFGTPTIAQVWKNGIATPLTSGSQSYAVSTGWGISGLGSDIYVVGTEFNGTKYVAKSWKNGIATSLTDGNNDAEARSIFLLNSDIYIAGYEYIGAKPAAKIWKNGIGTSLTNGAKHAYAWGIFVKGSDVYAVGDELNEANNHNAKIWKNGVGSSLTTTVDHNSVAFSVFVFGNDIYAAGNESNGSKNIAKIWKNGIATSLTNGNNNGNVFSIFVK